MIYGPTILTADGVYFNFEQPDPKTVSINAIARGLSNICRFGGQCDPFYSVAEHSIWVSRIVPEEFALAGLLHDAPEAFLGDMVKPIKERLHDYQALEKVVEPVVLGVFGITKLPPEVKQADIVMLATEQRYLMKNHDEWKWTGKVEPLDIKLECLPPTVAYHAFMNRWHELSANPKDTDNGKDG
jgi:5'-deoxynucleotidase YfbR-like HD superfamily hydrolase